MADVTHAVDLRDATIERLTRERDEARAEATKLHGWFNSEAQTAGRLQRERDDARAKLETLGRGLVQYEHSLAAVEAHRDRAIACLTDISRERGELVLLLRELEWRGATSLTYPSTLLPSCPSCGRTRAHRHREDCRLRAALE